MTIEQFVVGSIMVVALTAWVVWQFLFMPRLRELEERLSAARMRLEGAEHIIRNQETDTIKIEGEWGGPMDGIV